MFDYSKCIKKATISDCQKYRYCLSRIWDQSKKTVLFIMLNPSKADDENDDRTIRRCINFANSWGYGGIYVGNLFAYRTEKPAKLFNVIEPIGKKNDETLIQLSKKSEITVFAWGNLGSYRNRNLEVQKFFSDPLCLEKTKLGNPKHPLYSPATSQPIRF
jgi:hypothetical protein